MFRYLASCGLREITVNTDLRSGQDGPDVDISRVVPYLGLECLKVLYQLGLEIVVWTWIPLSVSNQRQILKIISTAV